MEKEIVKDAVNAFYSGAGIERTFRGPVNERVAEVFGKMLEETRRCTNSLNWVPQPTGGKATIRWVALNFSRSLRERMKDDRSLTCAKVVIWRLASELEMASQGL